jgi:hypothetical protein
MKIVSRARLHSICAAANALNLYVTLQQQALRLQKENGALQIAEASGKRAAALAQLESEKAADEAELAALLLKRTRLKAVCSALRAQLESSSGSSAVSDSGGAAAAEPVRASSH